MKLKLLLLPMSISVVLSGCWINNLPPQKTEEIKCERARAYHDRCVRLGQLGGGCPSARRDLLMCGGDVSVGGAKAKVVEKESAEETSYKEDRKKAEDKITEEKYQKEHAKARKHCSIYLKEIRKKYSIKSSNIVMADESRWANGETINTCVINITYPTVYGVQYGVIRLMGNLRNGTYEMELL
ncbi:MAG: hypothetical protein EKE20_14750 [Candidatus Symbiopectobacterium sp. Dall1.0]|nr:hypothetical protein [Candidatus Symbiopectobacterium sp. Dall1.0]